MKQAEIKVVIESEERMNVSASISKETKPSSLIKGLAACANTVAQALNIEVNKVIFLLNLYQAELNRHPDAVHEETIEVRIPKGLNLNGKEVQE